MSTTPRAPAAAAPDLLSPSPGRWQRGDVIGRGSFGTVYRCLDRDYGRTFVCKSFKGGSGSEVDRARLLSLVREVAVLQHLNHPNIVSYLGCERRDLADGTQVLDIFMEFMVGGSISDMLKQFGALNETVCRLYTKQICEGLEYLHSKNIVHRDVKPANVLVDSFGSCRLSDFGTAWEGLTISRADAKTELTGTAMYMAPEVLRGEGQHTAADVWALGCTVIEMLAGQAPYAGDFSNDVTFMYRVRKGSIRPATPAKASEAAQQFIDACLQADKSRRPKAKALLRLAFTTESSASFQRPSLLG